MRRRLVALGLLLAGTSWAQVAEPVTHLGVTLLQPSSVMERRVASVDAMADYIRAVEAAIREAVAASPARQSTGGFIVIAVRPGPASNVWLDFDTLLDLDIRRQIVARIKALPPFEVAQGPVVFGLKVALWNGRPPRRAMPVPQEWKGVSPDGAPLEVGELVERIWND